MALGPDTKVKVVVRQLPNILAVPHRVYQYKPQDLLAKGIVGPEEHMQRIIEDDIEAFKLQHPEFEQALFMTYDMDPTEVVVQA